MSGPLPLRGIRVIEFTHLIMGPVAGMILADLGADVIKVEPPGGDTTRRLDGFTSGFFDYFNRNKRSIAMDLKSAEGLAVARRLLEGSDVLIENFAPGVLDRLGLGYAAVATVNPRLVYCTLKGFLDGPYAHRMALDEVVQFMGGLAYMTGPVGQPLRAGTSVVDLTGGVMAVVSILAALRERERTNTGQLLATGLFECVAFLMGQHMAAVAVTGEPMLPMPARQGGWAVYRLFDTQDGERVFVGLTSDRLWVRFCETMGFADLATDPRLATNERRLAARDWLHPMLEARLAAATKHDILACCERAGIPCAPVAKVEDLFDDPHLNATGALYEMAVRGGKTAKLPKLPFRMSAHAVETCRPAPRLGEHTVEILEAAGIGTAEIERLSAQRIVERDEDANDQ